MWWSFVTLETAAQEALSSTMHNQREVAALKKFLVTSRVFLNNEILSMYMCICACVYIYTHKKLNLITGMWNENNVTSRDALVPIQPETCNELQGLWIWYKAKEIILIASAY